MYYLCSQLTFYTKKQFKNMTKKKLYERPSMKVVLLKRQPQLLAGSFTGDRQNPYGDPTDPWSTI